MTSRILQALILLGLLRVLFELGWHGIALGAFAVIFYSSVLPDVLTFFYKAFTD